MVQIPDQTDKAIAAAQDRLLIRNVSTGEDNDTTVGGLAPAISENLPDSFLKNSMLETDPGELGGAWKNWENPQFSGVTVGNGTAIARYQQIGKSIKARYQLVFGSTTSIGATISMLPPVPALDNASNLPIGRLYLFDNSAGIVESGDIVLTASETLNFFRYVTAGGTNPVQVLSSSNISTNQPWQWAISDAIAFTAEYEAA